MNLYVLPAGPIQTNAYLLTEPKVGEAILIDAPGDIWADLEPLLKKDRCALKEIWLTHGHWDHMQGAAEIVRATKASLLAHRDDLPMIETPEVMERFTGGLQIEGVKIDRFIQEGDRLAALGRSVEVRHVPGHCPGNVLFYFANEKSAFVGDALFRRSIGRTDFPGGSFEILESSIRSKIYTLPKETVVYAGHGTKTTVGEEMTENPFVTA